MRRRRRPVHVCVSIIQFSIMLFDKLDVPLTLYINYRPQRSCEGYVFTRVCHSVHGGWYPSMPCSRGVCVCYPSMPCSGGGLLPGGAYSGGACSGGCLLHAPPRKQTATVADGTYPTGMLSCLTDSFGDIPSASLLITCIEFYHTAHLTSMVPSNKNFKKI